jgi:hypothetical protein
MMELFAGDSRIAIEGDLASCDGLTDLPGAGQEETEALKRQTWWPRQDFVVLPLASTAIEGILERITSPAGIVQGILHVQIERSGVLVFSACDEFHPRASACAAEAAELLEELRSKGAVRRWGYFDRPV